MRAVARILIAGFCAVPGPTRSGVQLRQVVRALSGRHTVDLLAVRDGDQAYVERQGTGRLLRVPTHDADLATQVQAFQRALRRQLEGADYDVVHCRDGWSARPVLEGRDRFGYAVVYDLTRAPMTERDGLGPELAAAHDRDEEALLVGADLVLVPTEPARRYAIGRGAPDRVMLAPPGVDVDRFDWDVTLPDDPPAVLYAGAIAPGRGVRLLLQAMAEVVRTLAARLVLVGPMAPGFDGPLRAAIHELGLTGRVEIKAPIDHELMPAMIGRATVCVAPTAIDLPRRPYALYPTKLLEYLACRRAVVAPRRGAVTALVDHGREGLLFQPGDAADLARKLVRLLEDRGLRERLAATGYERVRRDFTASAARRAITAAYLRLAGRAEWAPRFVEARTGESAVTPPPAPVGGDDDFEATVFETAPPSAGAGGGTGPLELADGDVGLIGETSSPSLEAALAGLAGEAAADASDDDGAATPRPESDRAASRGRGRGDGDGDGGGDETQERRLSPGPPSPPGARPTPPPRRAASRGPRDTWTGQHAARADRDIDEGTPVDLPVAPAGPSHGLEAGGFVAGEIDVPTPAPELDDDGAFTAHRVLGGEVP